MTLRNDRMPWIDFIADVQINECRLWGVEKGVGYWTVQ